MAYASNAFGQLRYVKETSPTVIPGSGGTNLRQTGMTLKAAVASVKSEEIRQDRLSTGSTNTDLNVDGGFNFELSGKEYDPFLANLLGQTGFTHYGTLGLSAAIPTSLTAASSTLTAGAATSGVDLFTTLAVGSWIKVIPSSTVTQAVKDYYADKWFKVLSTSSTVITLDASTPIAAPGIGALGATAKISQSSITNGAVFDTFAMEYALTDITQYLTFTGLQANTFDLNLDVGAIAKGSFGFMGRGHTIQGTPLITGSAASQTLEVMNSVSDLAAIYENGTSILGATSFIKSLKLNVNNNTRAQKALGVYGTVGVGYGELAISGTLEVFVENAAYYTKWLAGTSTSLSVGMADAAGNGYMFDLDKIKFKDGGMNLSGRDDVMLSLPFDAFYSAGSNRGIRITRAIAA
jgi:hypothetical protein